MDATGWVIWSTIIFSSVAMAVVWFVNKLLFKHIVRIVDLGKQNLELDFKARSYNKDGVLYWQLDKEKNKELKNMPVPPAAAINIAKRGKKSVTAIRTPTGEYIYLERNVNLTQMPDLNMGMPKEIIDMKDVARKEILIKKFHNIKLRQWKLKNKGIVLEGTHQPFTSKQRMILVNNFEKAKLRKGFSLKEHIPTMVSLGALTLIVIGLMVFWGDIAQPAIEARKIGLQEQTIQKETLEIIKEIRTGQQKIISEQENG